MSVARLPSADTERVAARLTERFGQGILEGIAEKLSQIDEGNLVLRREIAELRAQLAAKESAAPRPGDQRWLTLQQASEKSGRSVKTLKRYIERGLLRATRPDDHTPYTVTEEELARCMAGLNAKNSPSDDAGRPEQQLSMEERALLILSRREANRERK